MKILKNLNQDYLRNFLISKQMKVSLKMKLKLLKLAYDKSLTKHVINLYLQVLREEYSDKSSKKLIKKITKFMDKIDYKKLQFKELSTNCLL